MGDSDLFGIILLLLPLGAGVYVAMARPGDAVDRINAISAWWERAYQKAKAKDGFFV